jgi:hypothetical protein
MKIGEKLSILTRYLTGIATGKDAYRHAPIFVGGCGHSGTSLLLAIIGGHSNIWPVPGERYLANLSPLARTAEMAKFRVHTVVNNKVRWAEKTPANVLHVDELLAVSGNAQMVIISRDGRDVVASLTKRYKSFEKACDRWIHATRIANSYKGAPRVHFIRYEDIITDFDTTISTLMTSLGETFEPTQRDYVSTEKKWYHDDTNRPNDYSQETHDQYRNWQINQPIFDGRGKWQKELTADQVAKFLDLAGSEMQALGYLSDHSSAATSSR